MFIAAAEKLAAQCSVYSYESILKGEVSFKSIVSQRGILRIESPGENDFVHRAFVEMGMQKATDKYSRSINIEFGEIKFKKYWYLGFSQFLNELQKAIEEFGKGIRLLNSPDSIQLMFDKWSCQQILKKKKIPVPELLGKIDSFQELQELLEKNSVSRVFLKPFYGSSASGVVAFRSSRVSNSKPSELPSKLSARTSVLLKKEGSEYRLLNSLKMQAYQSVYDIEKIVDALARDGLYVEKWLPKERGESGVIDFRVLVINGKAKHLVVRESDSPITNLHLGNKRADLTATKGRLGESVWEQIQTTAESAVSAIDGVFYAGVDLLVKANTEEVFVLEVNAFGDLLPNLLCEGLGCYETIVLEALNKYN